MVKFSVVFFLLNPLNQFQLIPLCSIDLQYK